MSNMLNVHTTEGSTPRPNDPRRRKGMRFALLTAAVMIALVTAIAVVISHGDQRSQADAVGGPLDTNRSEQSGGIPSDPAAVIEGYRIAYNSGDIEAVMALFADDSVLSGHPLSTRSTGLAALRIVQLRDIAMAAPTDAYRTFNVEVSGNTVTWDHEFVNNQGIPWCGEGNTAVIAGGKILNWAFAPDPDEC